MYEARADFSRDDATAHGGAPVTGVTKPQKVGDSGTPDRCYPYPQSVGWKQTWPGEIRDPQWYAITIPPAQPRPQRLAVCRTRGVNEGKGAPDRLTLCNPDVEPGKDPGPRSAVLFRDESISDRELHQPNQAVNAEFTHRVRSIGVNRLWAEFKRERKFLRP